MAKVIPATFPVRDTAAHMPGRDIDVPDAQELVEGTNYILARRRRSHFALAFLEGSATVPAYRCIETTAAASLVLAIPVRTGHATNPGPRFQYLAVAEQAAAAGPGVLDIRVLDLAATLLDTQVQNFVAGGGALYYSFGPTARLPPDTELVVEVRMQSGQAGTNFRLHGLSCHEQELALADMP